MDPGHIKHRYNRQGEFIETTDQNQTERAFDYDLLGRITQDRVVTLGSGVDGAVRRIETAFNKQGGIKQITSFDSASTGSGNVVNEVVVLYNGFGHAIETYQSHSGAVNLSTTPSVQMAYAGGSANTIRPNGVTYPDGGDAPSEDHSQSPAREACRQTGSERQTPRIGQASEDQESFRGRYDRPAAGKTLPPEAKLEGYRDFCVQDLIVKSHTTLYRRAVYRLPDGSVVVASRPAEIDSHFGAGLRRHVLWQVHQNHVQSLEWFGAGKILQEKMAVQPKGCWMGRAAWERQLNAWKVKSLNHRILVSEAALCGTLLTESWYE